MTQFLQYSGIALWALILLAILLQLIFGKNWFLRSSSRAFFGLGLVHSVEELTEHLLARMTL